MARVSLIFLFFVVFGSNVLVAQTRFTYGAGEIQYSGDQYTFPSDQIGFIHGGDLNDDGYTDLIVTAATYPFNAPESKGPQTGVILFNNGDNTFMEAGGDAPASEHAREIFIEDFNSDGIKDIFISDHGYDADPFPGFPNQLLLGTGDGFTDVSDTLPDVFDFSHNAGIGDIEGDGDIDIYVSNCCGSTSVTRPYLLLNNGSGVFEMNTSRLPMSLSGDNPISSFSAEVADLDGDNFPELILGRLNAQGATQSRIFWNDGRGNFSDASITILPDPSIFGEPDNTQAIEVRAIDVNGNGLNDLLIHALNANGFTGISVQLFINHGEKVFVDETTKRLKDSFASSRTDSDIVPFFSAHRDITGDGISDIVWYGNADVVDEKILISQGRGLGCYKPVRLSDISSDESARSRLVSSPPVTGESGTGFAEIFMLSDPPNRIAINFIPLTITPAPTFPNWFDDCSGRLRTQTDAGQFGKVALDFTIYETEPKVIIQAVADSVATLTDLPEELATFNSATGELLLPELIVDENIAFTNVQFTLIDGENLLFELTGSD